MAVNAEALQGSPEPVTNGGDRIREWTQATGSLRHDGSRSLTGTIIEGPEHELFPALAEVQRSAVLDGSIAVVDISGSVFLHSRPQDGKRGE